MRNIERHRCPIEKCPKEKSAMAGLACIREI
jgi:hypothetical protein